MSMPPPSDPLAAHAVGLADKVAVVDDRPDGTLVRWTFGELNAQANRLAHALAALGVKRGDRVVWCGQNSPGVVRMVHAARKLGAVAVPLNYRLTAEEAQYVVDDSDAVLAYVDADAMADWLGSLPVEANSGDVHAVLDPARLAR